MKNIIVIVGPTGVGKTKLSIELAKHFNGEIINTDSMQVYKKLDIGTAKATIEEQKQAKHHLLDIVNPNEYYSIFDYQKDARGVIKELLASDKQIIMVGGSGLYIKAALYDYKLNKEETKLDLSHLTNDDLYSYIINHNSDYQEHVNNRPRLEREYTRIINKQEIPKTSDKLYNFIVIGLTKPREELYEIINDRVDQMINNGLIDEVKTLIETNQIDQNIITGIGYKELFRYFNNELSKEEAISLIKTNSRRFAKRQYTYFNHQLDTNWFLVNEDFNQTIEEIINFIKEKEVI